MAATKAATRQLADATLVALAGWTHSTGTEVAAMAAADTLSILNVGTSANNLVQMTAATKLPAVDGSLLTALNATNLASGTVDTARLSVASQAEAEAGTSTTTTLTPQRVKQAVTAYGLSGVPDVILEDQRASGTAGGSPTAASWNTRTINTEVYDPDGLCTLSSNKFTFTVDGYVEYSVSVYYATAKVRIYNVTSGAVHALGDSQYILTNASVPCTGVAFLSAGVEYRIDVYYSHSTANGLGYPASQGTEIYGRVKFYRSTPA